MKSQIKMLPGLFSTTDSQIIPRYSSVHSSASLCFSSLSYQVIQSCTAAIREIQQYICMISINIRSLGKKGHRLSLSFQSLSSTTLHSSGWILQRITGLKPAFDYSDLKLKSNGFWGQIYCICKQMHVSGECFCSQSAVQSSLTFLPACQLPPITHCEGLFVNKQWTRK